MAIIVAGARTGYRRKAVERSGRFDLLTDHAQVEAVAPAFRRLPLGAFRPQPAKWVHAIITPNTPAAMACFANESVRMELDSSARELLLMEDALSFLPVHLPVLPELELDLIALQPRIGSGARSREHFSQQVRVYSSSTPSAEMLAALRNSDAWWARLSLALYEEQQHAGAGLKPLQKMWQKADLAPLQKAFVLRNLAVALMRSRDFDKADSLLAPAVEAFPQYGEFRYLAALSLILQGRGSKAVGLLEKATSMGQGAWPGSGGETWYRSRWLLGALCSDLGRDELAYGNFVPSVLAKPSFAPGVDALLQMDLPPHQVERLHCPLHQLQIREPQYSGRVQEFLERHGVPARLSVEQEAHPVDAGISPIVVEGPVFDNSSLARLNREIGAQILHTGSRDVRLIPTAFSTRRPETFPDGELLRQQLNRPPAAPALTICQSWPPDFRSPRAGRLVNMLHWEYSAIPMAWVEAVNRGTQHIWTPSEFTHSAFLRAGMEPEKVRTFPLGFSPQTFSPGGDHWLPESANGFVFLFVGGLIRRKGVDLLLDAYREAFTAEDDVTLVIKASGTDSFYRHNSLLSRVQKFARQSRSARIVLLNEDFAEEKLAALYRGANVLVHPYRGEGFGLPLLEAMACGRPVITVDAGPAPEFCPRESSILLPAQEVEIPDDPPPLGKLSGPFTWLEPDLNALLRAMRQAYENPEEMRGMGARAAEQVHGSRTWQALAPLIRERVEDCLRPMAAGTLQQVGA